MHNIHIAAKAVLLSVAAAAVGILIAAMLTLASVALAQAEQPYPPEPFALPATLITATPEQCAALPGPQQPESTECVRERGKEYAERLAQWLDDHPNSVSALQ